jgi:probable addiction module antidote protein
MGDQSARFTPYHSADYLTGIEDVAAYLEAAIDEGGDDPAFIAQALGTIARSGNLSELARRVGMNREGRYKALSAEGNPSFATIVKVARALGLRIHFDSVA